MKANLLNKVANSGFVNNHIQKTIRDDAFAAKTLVSLNVAKDVFAYGIRFATTMKNEEIPKERRPFVASMDLMSGVVTAVLQIGAGFSLANPKFQNMLWNKLFSNCNFKDITKAKKGFSQILALIGSTILAERILVPLIATPCAEKVEKKLFHKEDKTKIENIFHHISFSEFEKDIADGSDN